SNSRSRSRARVGSSPRGWKGAMKMPNFSLAGSAMVRHLLCSSRRSVSGSWASCWCCARLGACPPESEVAGGNVPLVRGSRPPWRLTDLAGATGERRCPPQGCCARLGACPPESEVAGGNVSLVRGSRPPWRLTDHARATGERRCPPQGCCASRAVPRPQAIIAGYFWACGAWAVPLSWHTCHTATCLRLTEIEEYPMTDYGHYQHLLLE